MRLKLLAAAITALTVAGPAFAADLPSRMDPPVYIPPPPPAFSWTGFYIGINGGYGGDKFEYPFGLFVPGAAVTGNASLTSGGFLGGGQVGFNYQFLGSNVVTGIEADLDASSIRGQLAASINAPGASLNASAGTKLDYLGTVRGRLGYAFGNILPYATGGFAYGRTTSFVNLAGLGGAIGLSENNDRVGWVVGGGLEYAITHNLTFKTEYLYANLGTKTLFSTAIGPASFNINEKATFNIVRAGLDWKFDWFTPPVPAPVVAKY
jgi:outer membrane immunogenic protein